jgi:AcrR family transcriptional regulator
VSTQRTNRRLERPREQVLEATLEMVAEDGLAKVTMASLARRLGTSGGHLLYYFGTRNGLLLETLRWSEHQYAEQRRPIVEAAAERVRSTVDRPDDVLAFAEVYLPVDERDPRWLLWLELWARAPYEPDLAAAQRDLDQQWHDDLVTVLKGAMPSLADAAGTSTRLRMMWDGFAIAIASGGSGAHDEALRQTSATVQR